MSFTPRLQQLLSALRCLPGVGPKSAQRIAFHLLDKDRNGAGALVGALQTALDQVGLCQRCRMFAEDTLCPICANSKRDSGLICVVETPAVHRVDHHGHPGQMPGETAEDARLGRVRVQQIDPVPSEMVPQGQQRRQVGL